MFQRRIAILVSKSLTVVNVTSPTSRSNGWPLHRLNAKYLYCTASKPHLVENVSTAKTHPTACATRRIRTFTNEKQSVSLALDADKLEKEQLIFHDSRDVNQVIEETNRNFDKWPYAHRTIDIITCRQTYALYKRQGRRGYDHAPEAGLGIRVPFVHTGWDRAPVTATKRPKILILTGTPATYANFTHVIDYLTTEANCEVVCPCWPDTTISQSTHAFWHSNEEKTEYIVDFLRTIREDHFDMLIVHSGGQFSGVTLLTRPEYNIKFNSLALVAPAGNRVISNMKPYLIYSYLARLYTNPKTWPILQHVLDTMLKIRRSPFTCSIHDAFLMLVSMAFGEVETVTGKLQQIQRNNIPITLLFGDRDRAVDPAIFFEMSQLFLGSDYRQRMWQYDDNQTLLQQGRDNGDTRVVCIKKGGHHPQQQVYKTVSYELHQLLQRTLAKQQ